MTSIDGITREVADLSALEAGATTLKPAAKSLWGYDGVIAAPDGSGSHRIAIIGTAEPFTDPDGFAWEAAAPVGRS